MLVKNEDSWASTLSPWFDRLRRGPRIYIFLSDSDAGVFRYTLKTTIPAQGFLVFFNGGDHLEHQLNVQFLGSCPGDFHSVGLVCESRNIDEPRKLVLSSLGTLLWGPLIAWQVCEMAGCSLRHGFPHLAVRWNHWGSFKVCWWLGQYGAV